MSNSKYTGPEGESRAAKRKRKKAARKAKMRRVQAPTIRVGSVDVMSSDFLQTYEWRVVRMQALKKHGARCQCCGASPANGAVMNVDHIKPRRLFPHLALEVDNLQILCGDCNHGKGNWDMTDWRGSDDGSAANDREIGKLLNQLR